MRTLSRIVLRTFLDVVYHLCALMPIRDRIVFASDRSDADSGSFPYLEDALKTLDPSVEIVKLFTTTSATEGGALSKVRTMIRATRLLATSRVFVIDDYYFPVYVRPRLRPGTSVVQLWHACGAFKKFGYSSLDSGPNGRDRYVNSAPIHTNYALVPVSSKNVTQNYAEAFNMSPEAILPFGVPRTDFFFDNAALEEARARVFSAYPALVGKRVVLYAPTFRGDGPSTARASDALDTKLVADALGEDAVLLIRQHPLVSSRLSSERGNVTDVSNYPRINDLLAVADLLITDYSSVIFEFSLLNRPMVFLAPDLDAFGRERDFYYPYRSFVPGPIASSTDELIPLILETREASSDVEAFRNQFCEALQGSSSKQVAQHVLSLYHKGGD